MCNLLPERSNTTHHFLLGDGLIKIWRRWQQISHRSLQTSSSRLWSEQPWSASLSWGMGISITMPYILGKLTLVPRCLARSWILPQCHGDGDRWHRQVPRLVPNVAHVLWIFARASLLFFVFILSLVKIRDQCRSTSLSPTRRVIKSLHLSATLVKSQASVRRFLLPLSIHLDVYRGWCQTWIKRCPKHMALPHCFSLQCLLWKIGTFCSASCPHTNRIIRYATRRTQCESFHPLLLVRPYLPFCKSIFLSLFAITRAASELL